TTSIPSTSSRTMRIPWRTTVWSSAISTRTSGSLRSLFGSGIGGCTPLGGHGHAHAGAPTLSVLDEELTPEAEDPFPDAREAAAAAQPARGILVEAGPVVLHDEAYAAVVHRQHGVGPRGPGVARHVRERLLERAVERDLRVGREGRERRGRRLESHLERVLLAEVPHERPERGQQAEVVQRHRSQVPGHAADAPDPLADERLGPVERRGER